MLCVYYHHAVVCTISEVEASNMNFRTNYCCIKFDTKLRGVPVVLLLVLQKAYVKVRRRYTKIDSAGNEKEIYSSLKIWNDFFCTGIGCISFFLVH